jgi:uncharacterized membrane protein YbhN (UPF0104 family)
VLAAAGATVVFLLFRGVDWPSAAARVGGLGLRAPLVLIPYFFMLLSDTLGWQATFDRPIKLAALWHLRVATEAVVASLPAGVAVGESLRVLLLERLFGLSVPAATANVIVSKLAMALAQGIFIVGGVALAISPVEANSPMNVGSATGGKAMTAAVAFLVVIGGAWFLLARGRILTRALALVRKMGGRRLSHRLARLAAPIAELERGFATLARLPRGQIAKSLAFFFAGWLCLGLEDWLLLRLLGADVSMAAAVSIEAAVSVVRIGFFFMPGGLGAQEASYYGLLGLYGVPNAEAIAAAFVLLKRAKELVWIALGYLLLVPLPAKPRDAAVVRARP